MHNQIISSEANTLWAKQNAKHFAGDIFKCILLNEKYCILITMWMSKGKIIIKATLVQVNAWHRPGDNPLA